MFSVKAVRSVCRPRGHLDEPVLTEDYELRLALRVNGYMTIAPSQEDGGIRVRAMVEEGCNTRRSLPGAPCRRGTDRGSCGIKLDRAPAPVGYYLGARVDATDGTDAGPRHTPGKGCSGRATEGRCDHVDRDLRRTLAVLVGCRLGDLHGRSALQRSRQRLPVSGWQRFRRNLILHPARCWARADREHARRRP